MPINLSWTDFPELFDNSEELKKYSFVPPLEKNLDNHLLISGDNYPVLQKLTLNDTQSNLTLNFNNKINLIYIDPPYNTGNDFIYNDNFSTSNDRHSAWLSFMNRRLTLAKKLLTDDGCIFIAIDQSELYTLKLLCDQIFGEDNFVNDFMWLHGKGKKDTWSRTLQQHTLCYAKNKKFLKPFTEVEYSDWAKTNPDNDERGNWFSGSISFTEKRSNPNHKNYYTITSPSGIKWTRQWLIPQDKMNELIKENKIFWGQAPSFNKVPREKIFNNTEKEVIPKNIIDCVQSTRNAQNHLDELLETEKVFDNPKPVDLIAHLIQITQMPANAIIMDFFAGSGTTFEAVCKLNKNDNGNRLCILVQKPEEIKKPSKTGSAFSTIFQICKTRCQKVCELYGTKMIFSELKN